jgi:hypothetical protein
VEAIMNHVDANRLGMVGAALMAAWHAVWIVLRAAGLGQRVMDFVFRIHGLKSDVVLEPFDVGMAALLLVATAVTGYVVAAAAGLIWNCLGAVRVTGRSGEASRA